LLLFLYVSLLCTSKSASSEQVSSHFRLNTKSLNEFTTLNGYFCFKIQNLKHPISISGFASVSALGCTPENVWQSYQENSPLFESIKIKEKSVWVSKLGTESEQKLQLLQSENPFYKKLDRSVIMAIYAARQSVKGYKGDKCKLGINIGSSRGATNLFEGFYKEFLETGGTHPLSSPTTTLGNLTSWIAQDLGTNGINISHSITCSSALHAVLNGITWLEANRADAFLVGGSEAPLTSFTIAQMQALKLYSKMEGEFACESMKQDKEHNTMVLGEGASTAILQKGITSNSQAVILGVGWGSEVISHPASISAKADCFQASMQMALTEAQLQTVDAIVLHAPGTVLGDSAELSAIEKIFNDRLPFLTGNKWMIGHTLGASGSFSLEMAMLMLKNNKLIKPAFYENSSKPEQLNTVMINAVGFGGNAVSIIIGKP